MIPYGHERFNAQDGVMERWDGKRYRRVPLDAEPVDELLPDANQPSMGAIVAGIIAACAIIGGIFALALTLGG